MSALVSHPHLDERDKTPDKSLSGQLPSPHPPSLPTDLPSAKNLSVFLLSNPIRHSEFSALFLSFHMTGKWGKELRGQRNENPCCFCVQLKWKGRGDVLLLYGIFIKPLHKPQLVFTTNLRASFSPIRNSQYTVACYFWCILVFHTKCSSGLNLISLLTLPTGAQKKIPFLRGRRSLLFFFFFFPKKIPNVFLSCIPQLLINS